MCESMRIKPAKNLKKKQFELEENQKQDIKQAFDICNFNESGKMTSKELKIAIDVLRVMPTKNEVKKITSEIDKDSFGTINYQEFEKIIARMLEENFLICIFNIGEHYKTLKPFSNSKPQCMEEIMTEEEQMELIEECSRIDDDAEISYEDFMRIMKKINLF